MKGTQPTFLLKGINHEQIVNDYINGIFDDEELSLNVAITHNNKEKTTNRIRHVQDVIAGKTPFDEIYETRVNGNRYRVYTTNIKDFSVYLTDIYTSEDESKLSKKEGTIKVCDHCRQEIKGDIIIVPTFYKFIKSRLIASGEYIACRFCCAIAIAREEKRKDPLGTKYAKSEQLLKYIATKLTGKPALYAAPGWKVLAANNGSMDANTFYNNEKEFKCDPSVVFAPIKSQWYA